MVPHCTDTLLKNINDLITVLDTIYGMARSIKDPKSSYTTYRSKKLAKIVGIKSRIHRKLELMCGSKLMKAKLMKNDKEYVKLIKSMIQKNIQLFHFDWLY